MKLVLESPLKTGHISQLCLHTSTLLIGLIAAVAIAPRIRLVTLVAVVAVVIAAVAIAAAGSSRKVPAWTSLVS